jgi:fructan beta-fructosidase
MVKLRVTVEGAYEREFEMELADGEPDWWAFIDLAQWGGRRLEVVLVGEGPVDALERIHLTAEIAGADSLYREARRPQLRFSSRRGWLNDPNGLVFFAGEYHLFYQHNPYGWSWGNMHWGHAVSRDLLHWEELPIALAPDELGPMYSGSAVVDWNDTAGFKQGAEPALVAIYTAAGLPHTQCIAASVDRGRTWSKYDGNPVLTGLPPSSRDPKVFWYAPHDKWVMAIYADLIDDEARRKEMTRDEVEADLRKNHFTLLSSRDLKHWETMSELAFPDERECPELFELPVEGSDEGETRWIFFGALGRYLVGSFDGERFNTESGPHALHEGESFYAAQTFNDIPAADGRRIVIPWGIARSVRAQETSREAVFAEMPFNQSMGLPLELTLRRTPEGFRIFTNPVVEYEGLRHTTTVVAARPLRSGDDITRSGVELMELEAELSVGTASRIEIDVRGVLVSYDVERGLLSCLDKSAPVPLIDGRIKLRLLVDRTAIDLFAQDGKVFLPMAVDLTLGPASISLRAHGGEASIAALTFYDLDSIWS